MPICIYSANSHIYISYICCNTEKNNKSCPTQTPNQPKSESDE